MCKISVLTPVYNTKQEELEESIKSILNQTFDDFEFIIINDGSTNNAEDVILSFDDKRIRYIKNESNLKLIKTLNKGLELSKGKYIARLDSDDFSLPERLEKQYNYMEEHENVGLLGTFIKTLPDNTPRKLPINSQDIKYIQRYICNCISHSSVMIRKETLSKYNLRYNENCLHTEDYKLWIDISYYADIVNLDEYLTYYRISEDGISANNSLYQGKMINFIKFACMINDFECDKKNMFRLLMKFAKEETFTKEEYSKTIDLIKKAEDKVQNIIKNCDFEYINKEKLYTITNFINLQ